MRVSALLACSLILVAALATSCSGSGYGSDRYLAATLPPLNITPVAAPTPDAPGRVRVPVLLYHHLQTLKANAGTDWEDSTVTPQAFEEQMAYLAAHNFHSTSVADLIAYLEQGRPLPENPVIITFDDGWEETYTVGFPILRKYGLSATFFIPANWVENLDGTLSWAQIEEMDRAGMEIGSHTMTHPYLIKSTPEMLTWELENSKARLEKHTSKPVIALAYPFGLYDDNVIQQTKAAGYRAAFTIEPGLWASRDRIFQLPRIDIPYSTDLNTFAADLQTANP
jgi:peptidoglycan/xylan/chitin deacetylase (PgdA/CDA1 family)